MKRIQTIFSLLLLASIAFADEAAAQKKKQKLPAEVLQPSLWERIEIAAPPECEDAPLKCAANFLAAAGFETDPAATFNLYRLGERDGKNLTVVIATLKVEEDDSLAGVRYRLVLSLGDVEDRSFKLETLGRQYKCTRGRRGWGKTLCP